MSAGTFSVDIWESVFCPRLYNCWFIVLPFVPHLLLAYELLIYSRIITANPDGRPLLCPIAYYSVPVNEDLKISSCMTSQTSLSLLLPSYFLLLTKFLKKHPFLKPVIKRSKVKVVPREIQLTISHNSSFPLFKGLPHLSVSLLSCCFGFNAHFLLLN